MGCMACGCCILNRAIVAFQLMPVLLMHARKQNHDANAAGVGDKNWREFCIGVGWTAVAMAGVQLAIGKKAYTCHGVCMCVLLVDRASCFNVSCDFRDLA